MFHTQLRQDKRVLKIKAVIRPTRPTSRFNDVIAHWRRRKQGLVLEQTHRMLDIAGGSMVKLGETPICAEFAVDENGDLLGVCHCVGPVEKTLMRALDGAT